MARLTGGSGYEVCWLRVWSIGVGFGIGFALLLWPFWAVVALTLVPVGLTWVLMVTSPPNTVRPARAAPPSWRLAAARAFVVGGSLPAVRALADLSLPVVALLVAIAALSSPPVVGWLDRHGPGAAARGADPEITARLQAWTMSGRALGKVTTDVDRLAVVERRQSMLDAWEELDPAGFDALLEALPSERQGPARGRVDDD
jgi:hypothetical protein